MSNTARTSPEAMEATIELAQALVRLDTANPPGNEALAAELIENRLRPLGAVLERYVLADGRDSLVARINAKPGVPALCFCGHIDTVPIGNVPWSVGSHSGHISGGKLWGRGSTDMKAAVAAMVTAFERLALSGFDGPLVLALCASEETGCQGAENIADKLGDIGAMVIGEPTNNAVAVAHKGVLWLRLITEGVAAHGSMPHLGENAIQKMSVVIDKLGKLSFDVAPHPLLGTPTHNIGTISGGSATNIVPDSCELTLDVRSVPGLAARDVVVEIERMLGPEVVIETILALDAVETDPGNEWIGSVCSRVAELGVHAPGPISVSYFTDASVLQPALSNPPIAIVGPGDPTCAHQVDEYCSIAEIWRSSQLYEAIARDWASSHFQPYKGNQK